MTTKSPDAAQNLTALLRKDLDEDRALQQGLANLAALPLFDPDKDTPPPVPGRPFESGVIGLRPGQRAPELVIACGTNMVRRLTLIKYVAMVENLHDEQSATIMLQNFSEGDDQRGGRGQVLGRINHKHSAITIIQGVSGRIIRTPSDIALYDVYYLDRRDLTAFYLTAKFQLSTENTLETMIAAHDGWRAYDIPLDPLKPFSLEPPSVVKR